MNITGAIRFLGRQLPRPLRPGSSRRERAYRDTLRFLRKSDSWTRDELDRYQLCALNDLLIRARVHVPGHARKLASLPSAPFRSLEEIAHLPFLTKDELRRDSQSFVSDDLPAEQLQTITSGGTTGLPTVFAAERDAYDGIFDACRHAMWERVGYRAGAPTLDLTASLAVPLGELPDYGSGRHYLSISHLTPDAVPFWQRKLAQLDPEFLVGFPSTASVLARLLGRRRPFTRLRALILASEVLQPDQRTELEHFFGCRVFCWYGMSELAGFACGCEHADTYHFLPQTGVVEVIDDSGRPVRDPGGKGEIVLTGFLNRATPFIRFRTGDNATLGEPCPHCHRPHPIISQIEGRRQDFLIGANGRVIPLSALNFHGTEFSRVLAHQFIQHHPGFVTLRIVPLAEFDPADKEVIAALIAAKLGADVSLTIELVAEIPRTPRGKHPVIVRTCTAAAAIPT